MEQHNKNASGPNKEQKQAVHELADELT